MRHSTDIAVVQIIYFVLRYIWDEPFSRVGEVWRIRKNS
jgi:hypothetical protein